MSTTTPLPNRHRSVAQLIAAVAVLVFLPHVAAAQCNSRYDPGLSKFNWAWSVHQFITISHTTSYTICYDERYKDDVALVRRWIDATLELGWQKYDIERLTYRGADLYTTVFLPPVSTQYTRSGQVINHCCKADGSVVHAELHYLTPSVWRGDDWGGIFDVPAEDYHPHYVMHEMSNLMHYSLEPGSRLTLWLREGLAEYDALFYTTAANRTTAIDSLIRYVHEYERETIFCCRTLDGSSGITTSSRYVGSAVIMLFLAERFGEEIHVELFTTPLEDLLEQRGMTVEETFAELQAWFEQQVQARNGR